VDNKATGGAGEMGGTVTVEQSGTTYVASYQWDPPEDAEIGNYDLYFMVRDDANNTAEDPFTENIDELELITSVTPPSITAGNTKCVPTSVNKVGSGTTKIYCEFTDAGHTAITDFNVTFKVRDENDVEILLVDNKVHGGAGEDANQTSTVEITYSGTIFTAWYEWDPPAFLLEGKYDLYFAVRNKAGGYAQDRFDDNLDELTLESTGTAPVITKVDCFPPTITIDGTNSTSIYGEFTDADNPLIANFTVTFKVRDPNGTEIIIVNGKTHGGAGEFGETVDVATSGTGFIATIKWDPDDTMMEGKYDLYFSVTDESFAQAVDDFDNNPEELELVMGGTTVISSDLGTATTSKDGKTYNFTIVYTDSDNSPPNADGVQLVIGSDTYEMIEADPSDNDYTDGKKYYYPIDLEDGTYEYNFKVTNTDNELVETDKESFEVGKEDKEDEADYTMLILAAIIILIVVILLLFLIMRKKSAAPEQPPYGYGRPSEGEGGARVTGPEETMEAEEPKGEEEDVADLEKELEEDLAEEEPKEAPKEEPKEAPKEEPPKEEPKEEPKKESEAEPEKKDEAPKESEPPKKPEPPTEPSKPPEKPPEAQAVPKDAPPEGAPKADTTPKPDPATDKKPPEEPPVAKKVEPKDSKNVDIRDML
jgi:hypothetical protein